MHIRMHMRLHMRIRIRMHIHFTFLFERDDTILWIGMITSKSSANWAILLIGANAAGPRVAPLTQSALYNTHQVITVLSIDSKTYNTNSNLPPFLPLLYDLQRLLKHGFIDGMTV